MVTAQAVYSSVLCRIQPNADTRKKQLDAWCSLVISYCHHNKISQIDVNELEKSPLFSNSKIDRKLPAEGIRVVLQELATRGNLEFTDKTKRQCLIMWRTPEEWGRILYRWVTHSVYQNTVCTLFELTHGDDTVGEEFHGLDEWLLKRAILSLANENKAELFSSGDGEGVKFY